MPLICISRASLVRVRHHAQHQRKALIWAAGAMDPAKSADREVIHFPHAPQQTMRPSPLPQTSFETSDLLRHSTARRKELMPRLLDLMGLKVTHFGTEAAKLAFFVGLPDFLLKNENDLMDCAGLAGLDRSEVE